MKGSITKRLILYFTVTLLIFAVIIGVVFTTLFTSNMTQHNRDDLTTRATTIAGTLSGFLEGGSITSGTGQGKGHGSGQGQGGFGAFLKLADDMAMGEVWLVDKDKNLITKGEHNAALSYDTLPADGDTLIQNALHGETGYSESFSELVGSQSITVCVPAYGVNGDILAAVLLHAPVQGMEEAMRSGLWILIISVATALLLSIVVAVLLSRRFIRPIKAMNATAKELADGDYNRKTDIQQNDEIGQLAETIDELSERLLTAKYQRERLDKEKQDFYADISHELRTPVTVMRGSLESLRDGKTHGDEKQQEAYTQLISETEHMQNMVNDLLDYSKLKNPDYKLEMGLLNLSDVLSDAVRSTRRLGEIKQIQVAYENSYPVIEILGNYEKLRQMFLIVLHNAVKFSPEHETVSVSVRQNDKGYQVDISDHGPGINEQDIPHLFDRFYKGGTKQNQGGTGIGLAIAKQIADRHDIHISVIGKVRADFCFTLKP